MTVLGEFLCMRSEIKAIPVGLGPKVDLWSFRKKTTVLLPAVDTDWLPKLGTNQGYAGISVVEGEKVS